MKPGDSLARKINRREYEGWEIAEINPAGRFVRFANEVELAIANEHGANRDAIFEAQISHTIEEHFRKQRRLRPRGIKVLSLFFIDKVANYIGNDKQPGIIREMFDRAFEDAKRRSPEWAAFSPERVRAAYFAEKRKRDGETELVDSSGDAKEDQTAYDLIMRDRETLLSLATEADDDETRRRRDVCFIFSHSALREGWDNPNVFQICTLNQTGSNTRKRQEVGRGVRLAVDQTGERVRDEQVNILTVVANESYRTYVESLQSEIAFEYRSEIEARYGKSLEDLSDDDRRRVEEEYGEGILPPPPKRAGDRIARLRKARVLSPEFAALWDRIREKTRYSVVVESEVLVRNALPALDAIRVTPPRVTVVGSQVDVVGGVFTSKQIGATQTVSLLTLGGGMPNIVTLLGDLMENASPPIRLTRSTLLRMFEETASRTMALQNPFEWATRAAAIIRDKLADHLVAGIQYLKTGEWYDMRRFLDEEECELFSKYVSAPDPMSDKTIYDLIPCDSTVETTFARDLEARRDVLLYVKLPSWFSLATPVGLYRPDWAIVMREESAEGQPVLYLVAETKGSLAEGTLRRNELRKIECGAAHFGSKQFNRSGALTGLDYKAVTAAAEIP